MNSCLSGNPLEERIWRSWWDLESSAAVAEHVLFEFDMEITLLAALDIKRRTWLRRLPYSMFRKTRQ